MVGLHTSCRIILGLALYTSTSASHKLDKKIADLSPAFESFHDSVYSRDANKNDSTYDSSYAGPDLSKRGLYKLGQNSPSDASILQQAYLDMVQVVTFVAANPNPQVMARYFSPADAADVTAIFNTVRLMAQPGGFPNPLADVLPIWTDLSDITVVHTNGIKELGTLAESDRTNIGITTGQIINVYDFGWTALWQRLLGDLQCARDIGPKTNYKMHFLGTLLLHETLHFDVVTFLAWGVGVGGPYLDDQAGSFPCLSKAYGPWEAIQLLGRDPALAKINIENYVWYALETFWLNRCPGRAPGNMFTAPKNNDIPNVCKQGFKGALASIWCWIS